VKLVMVELSSRSDVDEEQVATRKIKTRAISSAIGGAGDRSERIHGGQGNAIGGRGCQAS